MKVLKISAATVIVGGQEFVTVLVPHTSLFLRSSFGVGRYFHEAFPGNFIARANIVTTDNVVSAVVTMLMPACMKTENRLMVRNDTFEVGQDVPRVVVIGNIEFTFQIADVS